MREFEYIYNMDMIRYAENIYSYTGRLRLHINTDIYDQVTYWPRKLPAMHSGHVRVYSSPSQF